jgi:hypothetical protein
LLGRSSGSDDVSISSTRATPLSWCKPTTTWVWRSRASAELKNNANTHKYRDCAVFNYLFAKLSQSNLEVESARAVFVPLEAGKGLPRLWDRSGVFRGAHMQLSVREANNILAVWPVRKDGRYGKDE